MMVFLARISSLQYGNMDPVGTSWLIKVFETCYHLICSLRSTVGILFHRLIIDDNNVGLLSELGLVITKVLMQHVPYDGRYTLITRATALREGVIHAAWHNLNVSQLWIISCADASMSS